MRTRMTWFTAMLALVLLAGRTMAEDQTIIDVDGSKMPKLNVNDLMRLTFSGPSGRTDIKISVQGAARLISTNNVRKVVDGKFLIGAMNKEFLIQASAKGAAIITVSTTDTVDRKTSKKEYELDVE